MIVRAGPHPLATASRPASTYFPPELLLQATDEELREAEYHTTDEDQVVQIFSAPRRIFDYYLVPCHRLRNPFLTEEPSYHHVYGLLCVFAGRAQLEPEILIAALHYITLLVSKGRLLLCKHSWEKLVIASICVACKMWDDSSCSLRSMTTLLANDVDVSTLVPLESAFLDSLDFELFITPEQYSGYYTALLEFNKVICHRRAVAGEVGSGRPSAEFCKGCSSVSNSLREARRPQSVQSRVSEPMSGRYSAKESKEAEIVFPAAWKVSPPFPSIDGLYQS